MGVASVTSPCSGFSEAKPQMLQSSCKRRSDCRERYREISGYAATHAARRLPSIAG
jgi:hypothetical protein